MQPNDFDKERCAQRKRIAARRDGVNAAPMKFLRDVHAGSSRVLASAGWLPDDEDQALERINELRPDKGSPELTADDIYIHYFEAANDNFVGDRYMFMGENTLRNIAADAMKGYAFMNSHRTGGFSGEPTELPFGRTFAGRFEMFDGEGGPRKRTVVGFYMVKGIHPNGTNGPSTDDMHRMIEAAQIFDVSVGLWGGERICDVCGADLTARDDATGDYLCPHYPGSHRSMNPAQIDAQTGRGVTKGRASYTLENAHCSETSAVYDGAVPGAGFQKAMKSFRALSSNERAEIMDSFAPLFGGQENSMSDIKPGDPAEQDNGTLGAFFKVLKNFFSGADFSKEEAPAADTSDRDALAAENEDLKKKLADVEAEKAKAAADARTAEVSAFMKEHGDKLGANARTEAEALLLDAKSGKVDASTLPARLEALVKALPPAGPAERIEAGGKTVDEAVAKVTGDLETDPDAERDAKITARSKKDGISYAAARDLVAREEREAKSGA